MNTKWIKSILLLVAVLGSAVQLRAEATFDVIASPDVALTTIDKAALKDLLLGKTTYWQGGQAVAIVLLADKTDAALQDVTGMSVSQFKTHWQRIVFSGRGQQPKSAESEDKLVAQVAAGKGIVALVPSGTPAAGAKKLELK